MFKVLSPCGWTRLIDTHSLEVLLDQFLLVHIPRLDRHHRMEGGIPRDCRRAVECISILVHARIPWTAATHLHRTWFSVARRHELEAGRAANFCSSFDYAPQDMRAMANKRRDWQASYSMVNVCDLYIDCNGLVRFVFSCEIGRLPATHHAEIRKSILSAPAAQLAMKIVYERVEGYTCTRVTGTNQVKRSNFCVLLTMTVKRDDTYKETYTKTKPNAGDKLTSWEGSTGDYKTNTKLVPDIV